MKFSFVILVFLPLVVMGIDVPLNKREWSDKNKFRFSLKDLENIMPQKTDASRCIDRKEVKFIKGCVYLNDVYDGLTKTLDDYKIYSRGEAVALLAFMITRSFAFDINSSGDGCYAGQGTYTMQKFSYNYIYCYDKYKDDLFKIKGMDDIEYVAKLQKIVDENCKMLTKEQRDSMNAVRDLAIRTSYDSFATAPWLLAGSNPKYKELLAQDALDAYKKYLNETYGQEFYDIYKSDWNSVTNGLAKSHGK